MVTTMTNRPTVKGLQMILKNNKKNDAEQKLKRKTEAKENNLANHFWQLHLVYRKQTLITKRHPPLKPTYE
ncbi:hypothetical protein WMZ97_17155 [Lentibacillus sp. N15]|uniref:hypothetical protein n=1 Tax=Lentibacillus songyuanensis TaxID=3136161 RepID=UPI0031B9D5E6